MFAILVLQHNVNYLQMEERFLVLARLAILAQDVKPVVQVFMEDQSILEIIANLVIALEILTLQTHFLVTQLLGLVFAA